MFVYLGSCNKMDIKKGYESLKNIHGIKVGTPKFSDSIYSKIYVTPIFNDGVSLDLLKQAIKNNGEFLRISDRFILRMRICKGTSSEHKSFIANIINNLEVMGYASGKISSRVEHTHIMYQVELKAINEEGYNNIENIIPKVKSLLPKNGLAQPCGLAVKNLNE